MSGILDNLTASEEGELFWKGRPVITRTRTDRVTRIWGGFIAFLGAVGVLVTIAANLDDIDGNYKRYVCAAPAAGLFACKPER